LKTSFFVEAEGIGCFVLSTQKEMEFTHSSNSMEEDEILLLKTHCLLVLLEKWDLQ
jgi:hypothetical protein